MLIGLRAQAASLLEVMAIYIWPVWGEKICFLEVFTTWVKAQNSNHDKTSLQGYQWDLYLHWQHLNALGYSHHHCKMSAIRLVRPSASDVSHQLLPPHPCPCVRSACVDFFYVVYPPCLRLCLSLLLNEQSTSGCAVWLTPFRGHC